MDIGAQAARRQQFFCFDAAGREPWQKPLVEVHRAELSGRAAPAKADAATPGNRDRMHRLPASGGNREIE
jgi:hypothetical protein